MVNYTIVDWVNVSTSLTTAAAALETKLETLDSTTNPIYKIDIFKIGGTNQWKAILVYKG